MDQGRDNDLHGIMITIVQTYRELVGWKSLLNMHDKSMGNVIFIYINI